MTRRYHHPRPRPRSSRKWYMDALLDADGGGNGNDNGNGSDNDNDNGGDGDENRFVVVRATEETFERLERSNDAIRRRRRRKKRSIYQEEGSLVSSSSSSSTMSLSTVPVDDDTGVVYHHDHYCNVAREYQVEGISSLLAEAERETKTQMETEERQQFAHPQQRQRRRQRGRQGGKGPNERGDGHEPALLSSGTMRLNRIAYDGGSDAADSVAISSSSSLSPPPTRRSVVVSDDDDNKFLDDSTSRFDDRPPTRKRPRTRKRTRTRTHKSVLDDLGLDYVRVTSSDQIDGFYRKLMTSSSSSSSPSTTTTTTGSVADAGIDSVAPRFALPLAAALFCAAVVIVIVVVVVVVVFGRRFVFAKVVATNNSRNGKQRPSSKSLYSSSASSSLPSSVNSSGSNVKIEDVALAASANSSPPPIDSTFDNKENESPNVGKEKEFNVCQDGCQETMVTEKIGGNKERKGKTLDAEEKAGSSTSFCDKVSSAHDNSLGAGMSPTPSRCTIIPASGRNVESPILSASFPTLSLFSSSPSSSPPPLLSGEAAITGDDDDDDERNDDCDNGNSNGNGGGGGGDGNNNQTEEVNNLMPMMDKINTSYPRTPSSSSLSLSPSLSDKAEIGGDDDFGSINSNGNGSKKRNEVVNDLVPIMNINNTSPRTPELLITERRIESSKNASASAAAAAATASLTLPTKFDLHQRVRYLQEGLGLERDVARNMVARDLLKDFRECRRLAMEEVRRIEDRRDEERRHEERIRAMRCDALPRKGKDEKEEDDAPLACVRDVCWDVLLGPHLVRCAFARIFVRKLGHPVARMMLMTLSSSSSLSSPTFFPDETERGATSLSSNMMQIVATNICGCSMTAPSTTTTTLASTSASTGRAIGSSLFASWTSVYRVSSFANLVFFPDYTFLRLDLMICFIRPIVASMMLALIHRMLTFLHAKDSAHDALNYAALGIVALRLASEDLSITFKFHTLLVVLVLMIVCGMRSWTKRKFCDGGTMDERTMDAGFLSSLRSMRRAVYVASMSFALLGGMAASLT